ncbi:unnamed protein product, partial [Amoebophrya sp. A25]
KFVLRFTTLFTGAVYQLGFQYRNTNSKLLLFSEFADWSTKRLQSMRELEDGGHDEGPLGVVLRNLEALYLAVCMIVLVFAREVARVPGVTIWTQVGHVEFYNFLLGHSW